MDSAFAVFLLFSSLGFIAAQREIARGVCTSVYFRFVTRCPLQQAPPGETLSIRIVREISSNRCIQGQTFDLARNYAFIWVTGLCQAEFAVEVAGTPAAGLATTLRPVASPDIATASSPAAASAPATASISSTSPSTPVTTEARKGNYSVCGVPNHYRVIGGTNATACEYPWMVMVVNPISNISCGGAILDAWHILTASHCFFGINKRTGVSLRAVPAQVAVLSGTSTMPFQEINIPGLRYRFVAKLATHENYEWKTLANDIAILKLTEPIQFDGCHRPICLVNSSSDVQHATSCRAMGWGVNSNQQGAAGQPNLHWINLPVVSDAECRKKYRTYATANTFCAGADGKDTCKGDSGGPFVCSGPDGRFYAHGIVSAGIDSQCGKSLGLYTKISSYLPWIAKQLADV